eukprot:12200185-Alexandrium_andersonii.AAC.1
METLGTAFGEKRREPSKSIREDRPNATGGGAPGCHGQLNQLSRWCEPSAVRGRDGVRPP